MLFKKKHNQRNNPPSTSQISLAKIKLSSSKHQWWKNWHDPPTKCDSSQAVTGCWSCLPVIPAGNFFKLLYISPAYVWWNLMYKNTEELINPFFPKPYLWFLSFRLHCFLYKSCYTAITFSNITLSQSEQDSSCWRPTPPQQNGETASLPYLKCFCMFQYDKWIFMTVMLLSHDNLGTITTPRILPHRTASLPAATCLCRQYTKTQ